MKKTTPKKKIPGNKTAIASSKSKIIKKKTAEKPQEVSPFQPDLLKRDLVRQTIITILWKKEEVTHVMLVSELNKEIGHHFDGDIDQYAEKVKSDLILWKLMEETPGRKPVHYRLSQKLDKKEDDE
ncbi:MAG: hypothetical protein ABIO46_01325 [Chitinophagales bacterium]